VFGRRDDIWRFRILEEGLTETGTGAVSDLIIALVLDDFAVDVSFDEFKAAFVKFFE